MSRDRKDEIILATLELASVAGLGNVSMSQIADKVGIKKPSLYNHFESKEDIVEAMYAFLRENAKKNSNVTSNDYGEMTKGKQALEVLQLVVENYRKINADENMKMFYKVIYAERSYQQMAAQIMVEETKKMLVATKQLFYAMQIHGLLKFKNVDMTAVSFAMTIHAFMDFEMDQCMAGEKTAGMDEMIPEYLEWICNEYQV